MRRGFGLFVVGRGRFMPASVAVSFTAVSGSGASPLSRLARTTALLTLLAASLLALPSPASADECPNEGFRQEQLVTQTLGECRAYEKVSPEEKGLGDIVGDGATTVASQFGDAVAFSSRTPFGDTVGSGVGGQTQYVARRTDAAWEVHGV